MGSVTAPASVADDVLTARAYLSRVAEPASRSVWEFVSEHGPLEAAQRIRTGAVEAGVLAATAARRDVADGTADLDAARRHGIRLVVPEHPDWPHIAVGALERALARYPRDGPRDRLPPVPPLALWVRGTSDLAPLGLRSVAIVGARAATAYGERVAEDLGAALARHGITVVSGGAYGIDAAAHRGALAADGITVVVSAGGLDQPYPAGNARLFDQAAERGLVVSERPPGSAPHRHRFLSRNRLIAAFAAGTVVVEAALRSGAASTAGHSFLLGLPVMAVPGPVMSPMSAGCHQLLRRVPDPAVLVTCAREVVDVIAAFGAGAAGPDPGPSSAPAVLALSTRRAALDGLDSLAQRVFDGVSARRHESPEVIARRSGVSPLDVIRMLPVLDLAGLLDTADGGYRARPP